MLPKCQKWAYTYVGTPFMHNGRGSNGLDCWGLVAKALQEHFGVTLGPRPLLPCKNYRELLEQYIQIELNSDEWILVNNQKEVRGGDVVIFKMNGRTAHIGIMANRVLMLHSMENSNACLEDISKPQWNSRLVGFYRHKDLAHA